MSLRSRLMLSVALALIISLAAAGGLASFRAAQSVETELRSALDVSERMVRNAANRSLEFEDAEEYLRLLIAAFADNRHVNAILLGPNGEELVRSAIPQMSPLAPRWFFSLVAVSLEPRELTIFSNEENTRSVLLETYPDNEVGELWARFRDDMLVLLFFSAVTLTLVYVVMGHGLRPLRNLSAAIQAIGSGNYNARARTDGSPELAALANTFNAMITRLKNLEDKSQSLHQQIITIQDEERADLARDLHDDIGPFLFAVNIDAAAMARAAESNGLQDALKQARSIQDAVGHMQRHVRAILGRLRTPSLVDVGLAQAIRNLAAFWLKRYPEVYLHIEVADDVEELDIDTETTAYYIVQESLSNALQHGRATRIDISAGTELDGSFLIRVSDNGIGLAQDENTDGHGIRGMRERAAALHGTLSIKPRKESPGTTVVACFPQVQKNTHEFEEMPV